MTKHPKLSNWATEDGSPFDYGICKFHDTISEDTSWEISKPQHKLQSAKDLTVNAHLKTLSTMDLKYVEILSGIDEESNKLVVHIDKFIDCKKPITVWLDYPFSKDVKATIYPLVRTFQGTDTPITMDFIGYLMWQISKVYADIYKDHWKEVGVWGHGFEDLYLEGIGICKGNEVILYVGS